MIIVMVIKISRADLQRPRHAGTGGARAGAAAIKCRHAGTGSHRFAPQGQLLTVIVDAAARHGSVDIWHASIGTIDDDALPI